MFWLLLILCLAVGFGSVHEEVQQLEQAITCKRGLLPKWKRYLGHLTDINTLFQDYEHILVNKLSDFAKACTVSFPVIIFGASDGDSDSLNDTHVSKFYQLDHWQGLFVEAMENKIANWTNNLQIGDTDSSDRALVLHAAVHNKCAHDKIGFVIPPQMSISGESSDSSSGHVHMPGDVLPNTNWTLTKRPCVTPERAVKLFGEHFKHQKHFTPTSKAKSPHIASLLKVEIEDYSSRVLVSLLDSLHRWELPLLIISQYRILGADDRDYSDTSTYLESKGYEVSSCTTDSAGTRMIAFLRPKWIK